MFTADFIHAKVHARPFVPLRLVTESGETHIITHPDLVLVGKSRLVIGTACQEDPTLFEATRTVHISLITDVLEIGL